MTKEEIDQAGKVYDMMHVKPQVWEPDESKIGSSAGAPAALNNPDGNGGNRNGGNDSGGSGGNGREPTEAEIAEYTKGHDEKIKAYRDFIAGMDAPESKEDRLKREKSERSKRIVGAVSDGISALANLHFTTKYSPSIYEHRSGMGETVDRNIERMRQQREQRDKEYYQYVINLAGAEGDKQKAIEELRNSRMGQWAKRKAGEHAEEQTKTEQMMQPFKVGEAKNKMDKTGHEADKAKSEAEVAASDAKWADQLNKDKHDNVVSSTKAHNASAVNSLASANEHNVNANSKGYHFNGKTYPNRDEWKTAVLKFVKQYNTGRTKKDANGNIVYPIRTSYNDHNGNPKSVDIEQVAAQAEIIIEAERKENVSSKDNSNTGNSSKDNSNTGKNNKGSNAGNSSKGNSKSGQYRTRVKWEN